MRRDGDFPELGMQGAPAPHCDSSVLHAPGECEYCDHYPRRQRDRELQRINFTGHTDSDKAPCPSTHFRPLEQVERWPGNRTSRDPRPDWTGIYRHSTGPFRIADPGPIAIDHGELVVPLTRRGLDLLRRAMERAWKRRPL